MFNIGETVIITKGPMKGKLARIVCLNKDERVAIEFFDYVNPATKSGWYYVHETELATADIPSLYPQTILLLASTIVPTDIILNGPATIIKWSDKTKTVVKCQQGEHYDLEKGLAMAICKKALGNRGKYYDLFKYCKHIAMNLQED